MYFGSWIAFIQNLLSGGIVHPVIVAEVYSLGVRTTDVDSSGVMATDVYLTGVMLTDVDSSGVPITDVYSMARTTTDVSSSA